MDTDFKEGREKMEEEFKKSEYEIHKKNIELKAVKEKLEHLLEDYKNAKESNNSLSTKTK